VRVDRALDVRFSLSSPVPIGAGNAWRGRVVVRPIRRLEMGVEVGGFLGLLLLIVMVYAIVKIVQSDTGTGSKVIWVVLILLVPMLGVILWLLFGPKG
jgi:hypothetical protein